jgi:hypothetical protein
MNRSALYRAAGDAAGAILDILRGFWPYFLIYAVLKWIG